ncbi:YitT family protein [Virgibacillus sp. 179-BFC.A HS]|uniref:YitT family protein n=1 Tax=Tigheibacillus jepli TaxID=3035914 RepID=A0ABU5CMF3_9BACI|nr:YitT family protein [Virgibacillus sp. 179-BFC.A HS]MDY0407007.1 YitT family protein [Virgibacillus sp. 179-BFC.A HS]
MQKHSARWETIFHYFLVMIGATIVALSYNIFLLPSKLAAGGLSGVSTILFEMYQLSPALTQFIMNIPIFIIGWLTLGKDFSGKTLLGTFWVPFVIWISSDIGIQVTNPLLGAIYGGVILGAGLGIVYIGGGSTGGTAAIAQIVKKFTGISSGYSQLLVDGLVVIGSFIVFDFETTLFALMAIFITGKTIDMVQLRTSSNKLIMIITDQEEKIQDLIKNGIDRGLTKVRTVGGYSNRDKTMILCVADQREAIQLKQLLQQECPASFVIFLNASEILGRGFSLDKYYGQNL